MESLVPSKLHPQIAGIFVGNANGYRLQARLDACCLKGMKMLAAKAVWART